MKRKKRNNRILAGMLIFAMLITCVPLLQVRRVKAASISDFVNDAKWCNGISWGDGQGPKLSGWSSSGCCAYVCDFVKYVYGHNSYKDGATTFTSVNEIREGDVIYTGNHYFAVLGRNGNQLYTAEGNMDGKVCISNTRYSISGTVISYGSATYRIETGYHHINQPLGNNPIASLDAVEGGAGFIRVGGWGFDRDNLSTAIEIHVYIGGSAAEPQKTEGHVIYADKGRGDVDQAFSCGGYHGFEEKIPTKKTGEQVVWIYAINIGNGENTCLGSRTVNILPDPSPVGFLDVVEGGAGFIKVAGWSFDRDDLSSVLKIHVYIGENASSNIEIHEIQADKGRGDVDQALSCGQYHGFSDVIFTDKTGRQEVSVYAINVGKGDNTYLGSGIVNIASVSLGDIFQDGKVDGKDVSLLLQYRLGKKNLTPEQIAAGDVHKDGKIDGKDISKLLQYNLGKIESLK